MDSERDGKTDVDVEMTTMREQSRTVSTQSSMVALRVADPQEGVTVQELPPVDKGIGAWTFCAAGFVLEMMVWGFGFRFVSSWHRRPTS